ncbi:hypothetical protein DFH05DRAFT_1461036 [Lentinula detonsa]|uniref:Uncharacterized protein n=1 Tax=Lentinula detonsa TaxID=2804962 RepID=A0A9W8NXM6_9AGAR|nr:hypothetical protein DFH05DRAFT_1461036 [Lentinula detonsa]KAJ3985477.1 hypothetical protein F5890DRAFT_1473743 [Lentinula detonsa]
MPIRVGIALYYVTGQYGAPSYFHWVLVASAANTWAAQPILCLELKRSFMADSYVQSIEYIKVLHSNAFRGVVHLFTTSSLTLDTFQMLVVNNFPASDSGWRFPGAYGPQGWTCATWILQILWRMREDGTWISDRNFEHTYTRILNLGWHSCIGQNIEAFRVNDGLECRADSIFILPKQITMIPNTYIVLALVRGLGSRPPHLKAGSRNHGSILREAKTTIEASVISRAVLLRHGYELGESARKLYQDKAHYYLSEDAVEPLNQLDS